MRAAKAVGKLSGCTGSSVSSLVAFEISTNISSTGQIMIIFSNFDDYVLRNVFDMS